MWSRDNDGAEEIAGRERGDKHSANTWQHESVCVCAPACAALFGNCAKVKVSVKRETEQTGSSTGQILTNLHWEEGKKTGQTVSLFIVAINQNR